MSEKVLGFKEKDAKRTMSYIEPSGYIIENAKLVPVVSLKALKKWYKNHRYNSIKDLLSWAEKEACKK